MNEIDITDGAGRAERILPGGFTPSHLAAPMLRAGRRTADEYAVETLGGIRMAADILAGPDEDEADIIANHGEDEAARRRLARGISTEAGQLQRLFKAFAAGALLLALVAVATIAGPGASSAQAMEAPQPDPTPVAAQTVRVTLGAAPTTVYVHATTYQAVAPGWYCSSVYSVRGRVAGTCSISPSFPIPVTIDPRAWPVGRTFAQVVDDATDTAVSNVTFDARRPSRFGIGTYLDLGRGDLAVRVPVTLYSPALGRWVGQSRSPVQIQELVAGRWQVRATLVTNPPGLAMGVVHLGGGVHVIRAVRPAGATVWSTTGRTRVVTVTTEPLDIV